MTSSHSAGSGGVTWACQPPPFLGKAVIGLLLLPAGLRAVGVGLRPGPLSPVRWCALNNALTDSFPAGVAASSGSRALGLWAAHFPSAVFWWLSRWPPSHFAFVHLCPWYLYLAWNTSRGKIREWALSNPRRRRSLSGRTLFSPQTLHERNLRALHSVLNRPYRKARRSKPFLMQTGDSGSTKQGYNFYVELMWSRFGAFWEFDLYWASLEHLRQDSSHGKTQQICALSP